MNKTTKLGLHTLFAGLKLSIIGVVMLFFQVGIEGALIALPIVVISVGGFAALMGCIVIVGRLMATRGSKTGKEFMLGMEDGDKQISILLEDERNIALDHKVAYRMNDFNNWLFLGLIIFLVVMQVELVVTAVFLAVLPVKMVLHSILRRKYNREM